MGGMIAVVVLALLMVPVFFVSVMRFFSPDKEAKAESAAADEPYGPPALNP
jgi:multidrug efflux pump